ncbi:hypothetical protein V6N11_009791 [Hibiscus sabdariffa]|uniref:DUF4283 domain-containing protein n=1 Tax=Hibiscus sabdariffa TaxID=183260 RepID=A0ABR2A3Y7_9ROSI
MSLLFATSVDLELSKNRDGEMKTHLTLLLAFPSILDGISNYAHQDSDFIDLDDDDNDLLEDDITLGSLNGVSTIDFSDRAQHLAIKSMDLTLVVNVIGRRIGYNTLHNMIYNIWKPSHPLKLIDIENDLFIVKFSD